MTDRERGRRELTQGKIVLICPAKHFAPSLRLEAGLARRFLVKNP